MTNERVDPVVSLAYNVAARTAVLADHRWLSRWWQRLWSWVGEHRDVDVRTTLFGHRLRLTPTAVYPIYARRWPTYNDPLVEIVRRTSDALGRPVDVVDVGAAMGDTAALVLGSCAGVVRGVTCIEGDAVFASYLRENMTDPRVVLVEALLSDVPTARALVRNAVGTATAVGDGGTPARLLDDVLDETGAGCDVLKVDVDGYDGRVLAGGRRTIERLRPTVFFEWDPGSYERSGSSWRQPFELLAGLGYRSSVWFDKYGRFAHLMVGYDEGTVEAHARLCLESKALPEWHYDVVALHESSAVDPIRLAELQAARRHKAKP